MWAISKAPDTSKVVKSCTKLTGRMGKCTPGKLVSAILKAAASNKFFQGRGFSLGKKSHALRCREYTSECPMGNGMVAILRHQHWQARQKVSLGGAWGPAATYPQTYINQSSYSIVSSDRSSCSDDGLLYIYIYTSGHFFRFSLSPLMQLMLQVSLSVA